MLAHSGNRPLGHDEVAVNRRAQRDVDAADGVDVAKDQQHGPRHGLEHLHDAVEAVDGHLAHVGCLLLTQDVGQAQLTHVDGPLQQHLTEEEVLYTGEIITWLSFFLFFIFGGGGWGDFNLTFDP